MTNRIEKRSISSTARHSIEKETAVNEKYIPATNNRIKNRLTALASLRTTETVSFSLSTKSLPYPRYICNGTLRV